MKKASLIVKIATLGLAAWGSAPAAGSRAVDPLEALQWLEAPASERALTWARQTTAQSRATLGALPGYPENLQDLRATLQTATPVSDVALLGPYAVRLQRDAAHPRGLLQRAERRGDTLGAWVTVLDVGALSEREHVDYDLRFSAERCLPPAFDRCLLSFGVGGGDAALLREFNLTEGRFVEGGFTLPRSLHAVAWLDRDTLVVGHDLDGAKTTAAKWPAQARLWHRGTALNDSVRVFDAGASDVLFQLHGLGGNGRALLLQAVDFSTFHLHLIDARGGVERLALPSKLKIFGFQGATARHVLVQLTEAAMIGETLVPAETIVSYDLAASSPSQRVEVVYTPRVGEVISSLGFGTTQTRVILPVRSQLQLRLLEARHEATGWRVRPLISAPAGVDVRVTGADPVGEGVALAREGFLVPPSTELLHEDGSVSVVERSTPVFDAASFTVQVRQAQAADGERIDYFLIAPRQRDNTPIPTLITGYGGFGVSLSPAYPGSAESQMYGGITLKLWFEHGGALVVPAIRGGGERGAAWHRAALGEHRQRAFDDLYAVASDLIHAGITDGKHLGVFGTSNGGLLAAVAGLQRPDLFGAVVSDAPLTDMLRFTQMGMGAAWVGEYGDPHDRHAAAWLKRYSPLHRVQATQKYPPFLITVSARDDRVGPGHARKLAKRLRDANAPALFVETEAGGHSVSDPLLQPELMAMRATFLLNTLRVAAAPEAPPVQMRWNVRIPLRDGVQLSAIAYLPKKQTPVPCVFTLTPYVAQTYHDRGVYFATHGYPFLAIDVRGRGNSDGDFQPMIQEAHDGYDVVEWLARQPYCNGKVAMWGGSYSGYNQWATAKEFPPHLATIVPAAAPYAGVDFPSRNNISTPYDVQWLTYTSGRTAQDRLFGDANFWAAQHRHWYESGASLRDFDTGMGNPSAIFQEWLNHPHLDAYWDRYNPSAADYAKLRLPVLTITGSYDANQYGALTHYREHVKHGSTEARASHYLVIGPWDHSGTRTPKAEFGGLSFAPASLLDLPQLHLDWYAWTMGQGPKPSFLKQNVAYYVMGAERWRYADTLDAVTAERRPYYLASKGPASDVFSAGELAAAPGGGPDRYRYDPRDTSTAEVESVAAPELTDQRLVYARAGRQLVYHTAPFAAPTEISGFFKLSAWLAIDQPDTDFSVNVYEVAADGSSILLSADLMRVRYRESFRQPTLIQTRAPLRYDFDRFAFVSRQVRAGSRLRLVISPLDSIYWEKNYNSGGEVAAETRADARTVTVTLYHDRAHPSALYVPIGQPEVGSDAFVTWARPQAIAVEDFPGNASGANRVGEAMGAARMVALGEPAHGAHEPLEFRNRLLQFLVEQQGFTAIALESGFNEARRVNEFVLGGEGDPTEIAREGLTWGFGTFTENVELLRWIRQYNAEPGRSKKVKFYGVDLTGGDGESTFATSRLALDDALRYLARIAPEPSAKARAAIEPFLGRFSLSGYQSMPNEEQARLRASIENVVAWLQSQRTRLLSSSSEGEYEWALRSAIVARQLETLFRLSPANVSDGVVPEFHRAAAARDAAMADNALWALRREGASARVLLFAHNAHVMNGRLRGGLWKVYPEAPVMMGAHLRAALGKALVIIGASAGTGGAVDATLSQVGGSQFMLDLRGAPPLAMPWLKQPQSLQANYTTEMEVSMGEAFDAMVYFEALQAVR